MMKILTERDYGDHASTYRKPQGGTRPIGDAPESQIGKYSYDVFSITGITTFIEAFWTPARCLTTSSRPWMV